MDCEEGWVPKNWCFWTVVLEKSLLDCKEIQLVHSEGDQPWDFFGRNDAEAETPVLWPPHVTCWLIGKDSDAGTDWGQEEKGPTEDEMAGWHYWLNGREFRWTPGVGDGRGGLACCDSWGHKESEMTEQVNWTNCLLETNNKNNKWVIMETKCRIRVKIIVNNAEKWMSAVKIRKYEKFLSWRIEGNRKGNLGINTQRYNGKKKNFLH